MMNLLFRFLIVYFVTIFSMKLMGKRQIGELQMSELVTTFFLSELATCTIVDERIPLLYGLVPIVALLSVEVILSGMTVKIPFFKRVFDHTPSLLVRKGKLDVTELKKNRITIDEYLSLLRLEGIADPGAVYCAVLEANGRISFFLRESEQPLLRRDGGAFFAESGISHALIEDGKVNGSALKELGKDEKWLLERLKSRRLPAPSEIFLYMENENGNSFFVEKKRK